MTSFITLAVILLSVFPLCVFTALLDQQTRKARVAPAWHLCLAAAWLAGVPVAFVVLFVGLGYLERSVELSEWVCYPLVFLTGPLGGSVGPGAICLYLQRRRTFDADYEDYPRPIANSPEAERPWATSI
ncbi:MAG TPA: hypothetical protein VKD90_03515 [Gemmataceae bacterium]|nr:hypothetical protein [Gemmataceae bacterium]